jgi:transposase
MTQENTEISEKPTAKSAELKARIRYAATLKYLYNLTDAKLAEQLGVSIHTIADWKRRSEWDEAVREIANKQLVETSNAVFAMAPSARDVYQELLRDAPPAVRLKAAHSILKLVLHSINRVEF